MIKIATAQIDVIPGNIRENWKQIEKEIQRAREKGAHMLVLPEMCLTGYLIGDLWDQNAFLRECEAYNEKNSGRLPGHHHPLGQLRHRLEEDE